MNKTKGLFYESFQAMNSNFEVTLVEKDTLKSEMVFLEIKKETRRLENKLSRFNPFSIISYINKKAGIQPIKIDAETLNLLKLCQQYSLKSLRYFDITTLSILKFWKNYYSQDPAFKSILANSFLESIGSDKIILDEAQSTISFTHPKTELDLSGIGKGYALLKAKEILTKNSIKDALLNIGNTAILALGNFPKQTGWKINIKNALAPEKYQQEFSLLNQSLSISGYTAQNLVDKSKTISAIFNPKTGQPVDKLHSTSAVCENPLDAEVISIALLASPEEERKEILRNFETCQAKFSQFSFESEPSIIEL